MNNTVLWMWLCESVKLKRIKQLLLLKRFQTIENIYNAGLCEYSESDFLTADEINLLLNKDISSLVEDYKRLESYGVYTLTIDEPEYPELLRQLCDAPTLLYCKGKFVNMNEKLCISVVGTRKATPYGKSTALNISKSLASHGVIIVSGMALGIDTKAHEGALAAGAPTVAVVGCGLDTVYPTSNTKLMSEIEKTGMIISEYPIGTIPAKFHFPERNRIISGISQGTLVVEADIRSGSLITARCANEQGRDIFAVPGNINSIYSRGTNSLIKDGAHVATCAEDVLHEYTMNYTNRLIKGLNIPEPAHSEITTDLPDTDSKNPEDIILHILKGGSVHIDRICELSRLGAGCVNSALLLMELRGLIIKAPGGYYELNSNF